MHPQLSTEQQSHLSHNVEVLNKLIPTLSQFNNALFTSASKLFSRSATQSLMGMAMHGKQCEKELNNVAMQYNAELPGVHAPVYEKTETKSARQNDNALQYAIAQEPQIQALYETALADETLDDNLSHLLRTQLLHLNHLFTQLKQLYSCQPQIGLVN